MTILRSCRLIAACITVSLAAFLAHPCSGADRPSILVGIVVDQLQTDYLEYLRPLMTKGGFNRLVGHGLYITDLDFGVPTTDAASATAQLYTGAWPANTGIPAATLYDRRTRRATPVLLSANHGYTPEALRLSTITDEIAVDGQRFGKIYSISADAQMAVLMGGHAPSSAAWIDINSGKWTTSAYYTAQLPPPLAMRNVSRPLRAAIDTMRWEPLLDIKNYPGLPPQKKYYPFSHTYRSSERDVFSRFAISPLGNREVTDMALKMIQEMKLGKGRGTIDMLNIGYSLAPFTATRDGDYRLELTDAYLRLDRDLERLLTLIDKEIGTDNVVVFLLSTGHFTSDARPDNAYRIPGGELSTKRAAALLNSYLSARYGHADYVESISGTFVYLNVKAMEAANNKPLATTGISPLYDARDFLSRMDGIASVATVSDILAANTESMVVARRAIDAASAGDLIIEVQPGWTLNDDFTTPATKRVVRRSAVATPAIIYVPSLPAKLSPEPISALRIAPTICRLLKIQSPNGAVERSIPIMQMPLSFTSQQ